ncbi:MAG: ABC transporter substrate-binding protein [Candidatus Rokuibacteriota bacterium]|nr:MAG: ABC transporter substrate-binding protein [Candidatus Rokubacteria bacterium]
MHRRSFLVAVAILIAAPLVAEAQPAQRLSRVGVLAAGSAEEATNVAFFERMRELGYVEGQTVVFDRRFATGRIEQLSAFATQIVAANPDVIFAPVTPAALAARKVTKTIPIVFAVSADPIDAGLVTSLREPGGNITGIINMNVELAAKRLELLRQVAPRISRIAVFSNLDNVPDRQQVNALRDTAAKVAVAIVPIDVRTENDYNIAFERPETQSAHAIMILPSPLNIRFRSRIIEFAARHHQPTMDAEDRGPREGAFMSYGPNWASNFRQAADLVHRILKGAKPADLPVEQPTKIELVINMKTAKALGLTMPPSLLLRADQVIE